MTSWVVALEVGEDPDGPGLDAAAMARRMAAVGDIRPTAYGKGPRRHSFLLRMDGRTATDAVVSAVSRFHEAAVGGALLGARVVRLGDPGAVAVADDRPPAPSVPPALRPKVVAVAAAVLIVGACLLAVPAHSARRPMNATAAAATRPVAVNLLTNASFELGSTTNGLARGLTGWGDVHPALVDDPVHSGDRAQQLHVGSGQRGGAWFDVDAVAGRTYVQSAWVDVQHLDRGSRVDLLLAWYAPGDQLLSYQAVPVTPSDAGFVSSRQTLTAPPGTTKARFNVKLTGGGTVVVDDAALRSPLPGRA